MDFPCSRYDLDMNSAHLVSLISVAEHRLSALFYLVGEGEHAGNYVLVSSARTAIGKNEETCIFISDEFGEPKTWLSLYRRLDFDQETALKNFGYPVQKTT